MLVGFEKNLMYNGLLLADFENQTEEMCLVAVKQNGLALEFVRNQTEEICTKAVKQNGLALKYVEKQTEAICRAAYNQNQDSVSYIKNPKIRKKISDSSGTMILHPNMDLDDVIEFLGRTKTIKPVSGGFTESTQNRTR